MANPAQFEKLLKVLALQGYEIGFLQEVDVEAHREFIIRNWPKLPLRYNLSYNLWRFKPANGERFINIVVCKSGNEIVGQIGYVRGKIKIGNDLLDAYWGANFKVNEELISMGIGAGLEIFAAKYLPILIAYAPTPDAQKYKKQLGYQLIEGAKVMMLPLRVNHVVGLKTPDRFKKYIPILAALSNPVLVTARRLQALLYKNQWVIADENAVVDRVKMKQDQIGFLHCVHDKEFLKWRLNPPTEVPNVKPQVIISGVNEREFVIYRIANGNVYLHDYYFQTSGSLLSFVNHVFQKHGAHKINTIQCYANTQVEENIFKNPGSIGLRRKAPITAFSQQNTFDGVTKMYVDLYDGEGNM